MEEYRPNLIGKVDPAVENAFRYLFDAIYSLRREVKERPSTPAEKILGAPATVQVSKSYSIAGRDPLNVEGLIGELAQPQKAKAIPVTELPSAGSPLARPGALVIYNGNLYWFDPSTGTWKTFVGGAGNVLKLSSFGTVGDGATDDTVAVQTAFDYASLNDVGLLIDAASVAYLCGEIDVPSNLTAWGFGEKSKFLRSGAITSGRGWFDIDGESEIIFSNCTWDGDVTTPVGLLYSAFSSDPMNALLTNDSTFWLHNTNRVHFRGCMFTHTGGYAVLLDAESADITKTTFVDCYLFQNRPHLFGTSGGDLNYGSWTGGIFYRGNCNASLFAVKNLLVSNCTFARMEGNCLWGHSTAFNIQHSDLRFTNNHFEDFALDGILIGNVNNFVVSGNTFHRGGFTHLTDNDTPVPAFLTGLNATALDTSGYAKNGSYSNNSFLNINGGYIDCDGLRDTIITGNSLLLSAVGDPAYTEDDVASFTATAGINLGNTQQNGGATHIDIIGNFIRNMSVGAVRANYAKYCRIAGNVIEHSATATEVPISLFAASGGSGNELLNFGNVVENNTIRYDGANLCVAETGTGWTTSHINRVFNNQCSGTNQGEFLRIAGSASVTGFSITTNDDSANDISTSDFRREGFGVGAALKIYKNDGGVVTQVAQLADATNILNVSDAGAALTGGVATGNISSFVGGFCDAVATSVPLGVGFMALYDYDGSTYDTYADLLPDDYLLMRWNKTAGEFQISKSVTLGVRDWINVGSGGGSVGGANKYVQFNDSGAFGGSINFQFDKTTQVVTIIGLTGTAGLDVQDSYIQSEEGFYSPNTASDTVNIPAGGVTALSLISIRDDADVGVVIARAAATARTYGFRVDASGNLLLRDSTGAADRLKVYTNGLVEIAGRTGGTSGLAVIDGYIDAPDGLAILGNPAFNAITITGGGGMNSGTATLEDGLYLKTLGTGANPSNPAGGYGALGHRTGSTYWYWNGASWASVDLSAVSSVTSINSQTGPAITIAGTTNRISVSAGANIITLTTPQDLHTAANVTFGSVVSSGNLTFGASSQLVQGATVRIDTTGGHIGTVFNATNTGASITFQNSNTNFQVDGNGNISSAGSINVTGANPYRVSGTTVIDSSRNASFVNITGSGNLTFGASSQLVQGATVRIDTTGGHIGTVFNATNTGGSITFQNSNSNFSVNGNGDISGAGAINMTGVNPYKVGGTTIVDASRNATFASVTTNAGGVVQSGATGATISFQNTNFNFQVDGNGNVSSNAIGAFRYVRVYGSTPSIPSSGFVLYQNGAQFRVLFSTGVDKEVSLI